MWEFYASVVIGLALVVVYENDWLVPLDLSGNKTIDFVYATVMELLTICCLPLTLRLFKIKQIHRFLSSRSDLSATRLMRLGSVRLITIGLLIIANTLLYYSFMNVAFGYMAIISFLCMFFIYPSKRRCDDEVR